MALLLLLVIAGFALLACSGPAATPDAATPDAATPDAATPGDADTDAFVAPDSGPDQDAYVTPDAAVDDAYTSDAGTCGDGVALSEACDDGNDTDGDGCSADCTTIEAGFTCPSEGGACSTVCGDGLIVGTEECDDGNTVAGDGCDAGCVVELTARRVFISSMAYPASLGGVAGADSQCQALADAASLGGTWRAWLSDSTSSPSTRFTRSTEPYVRVDGTAIAADWAGLTSGTLLATITVDESGATVAGSEVWTATGTDGSFLGSGCNDFTSGSPSAPFAMVGVNDYTSAAWTGVYLQFCDRHVRLYCFEQ